ncbi:hypothetical protein ACFQZT_02885 [Paenibacillus sp. GCM10027628]|uniref:hypothetical protein n=1 Tax=Paenibacillus sp. GCM10027628 TaxID=3273413 RepID=UPI00362F5B8F
MNLNLNQKNYITLGVTLLGALKLTAQAFNISFISDDQINAIANLAAVVLTIAGVVMTHNKNKESDDN